MMKQIIYLLALTVLLLLVTLTPIAPWLEASMTRHVLLEFPLIIAIGYVAGLVIQPFLPRLMIAINAGGVVGILLCTFSLAFWMIPRWLDESLNEPAVAMAKYLTLVFLIGMPLALSWERLHTIARGVVKIEFLSMLYRLGWLYWISPDRFCNNYLLGDQVQLGQGMLAVGLALSLTWLVPLFIDTRETKIQAKHAHH